MSMFNGCYVFCILPGVIHVDLEFILVKSTEVTDDFAPDICNDLDDIGFMEEYPNYMMVTYVKSSYVYKYQPICM